MNIKSVGQRVYKRANKVRNAAISTLRQIPKDPAVMKNIKSAAPVAAACVGGFSLLALLKNRKKDGKPGKIECASGSMAQIAFLAAGFRKFFPKNNTEGLKKATENVKKFNFDNLPQIIRTNKLNVIAFGIGVLAIKPIVDILTKAADFGVNKVAKPKTLDKQVS